MYGGRGIVVVVVVVVDSTIITWKKAFDVSESYKPAQQSGTCDGHQEHAIE